MGTLRFIRSWLGKRRCFVLCAALAFAPPSSAACDRVYSVAAPESGTFAFTEKRQLKGLTPLVIAELARRTGCEFEVTSMPVARQWVQWKAGSLDIATAANRTPERDQLGAWTAFVYAREVLITAVPPPGRTLEGWLNLPQRPLLGHVRSSSTGGDAADQILARPQYATQVDEASDRAALVRKLFAKRNAGVITTRPSFDLLARELGFDAAEYRSYVVEELPRTIYGFYFRSPQVSARDQRILISALEDMLKSGFDESAYSTVVGKAVAAQLYQDK